MAGSLVFSLLVLTAPPVGAKRELAARRALQAELRRLLRTPPARRGILGIVIKRLSGPVLFARRSRRRFHPASCVKILTAAAALRRLGPDYRFDTVLLGDRKGDTLASPLYLWGQGDPSLTYEDLVHFAQALSQSGIRSLPKGIRVDDSFFSRRRFPPGYGKPDDSGYAAPTGALSLEENRATVKVSAPGCQVRVEVFPPSDYLVLRKGVRCGPRTRLDVSALRGRNRTLLVVSGTIRRDQGPFTFSRRIFHPSLFMGLTFARVLQKRGLAVGPVRVVRRRPRGLAILLRHRSAPLSKLVTHMNHESDNFYAEQILRALGAKVFGPPGTTSKGLRVVAGLLARSGVPRGAYRITNGSGLFGATRLSPRQFVKVLEHLFTLPWLARALLESLPLAGRSGTLAGRPMGRASGRVRAKTGTLRGVSCLAGYVLDRAGRPQIAFAVMHNRFRGSVKPSRRLQDAILDRVAAYLDEASGRILRSRRQTSRPSPDRPRPRPQRAGPRPPAPRRDARPGSAPGASARPPGSS